MILEIAQILVHAVRLVPSDETTHRVHAEQDGRVEHAQHERVLLAANGGILMQHVVEIADVRQPEAGCTEALADAARTTGVERPPQVERVRHGIEHRRRRYIRLGRVRRRRQLDRVGSKLARELNPVLDRPIGVHVPYVPRRQLLQRGREDSDLHELRFERLHRHRTIVLVHL
jgi:hypothetical protein